MNNVIMRLDPPSPLTSFCGLATYKKVGVGIDYKKKLLDTQEYSRLLKITQAYSRLLKTAQDCL